jgi:small subunit ribosomal protein S6
MAPKTNAYDLTLLLDSAADADRREQILADVEGIVQAEGEIVGRHDWGARPMAYEIRHKKDADFHLLQFEGGPALLERLNRTLRITDGVLRFRIIRRPPGSGPPADLPPVSSAAGVGSDHE